MVANRTKGWEQRGGSNSIKVLATVIIVILVLVLATKTSIFPIKKKKETD